MHHTKRRQLVSIKVRCALLLSLVSAVVIMFVSTEMRLMAGEWVKTQGVFQTTAIKYDGDITNRQDGYLASWSCGSVASAGDEGGRSTATGFVKADTKDCWFVSCKATAEPPAAAASGAVKRKHLLPSHGQGQPQGIYRASARVSLSFSASFTASGATASMVAGGTSNGSCAVGASANYSISQLNIGCDTKTSKEYGFGVTVPGGSGISVNTTKSEIGRYDSGPQLFSYLYSIDEAKTSFDELIFRWQCDASLRLSAFASPGWMESSRASGSFVMDSKVSDVVLEVVDGPSGS